MAKGAYEDHGSVEGVLQTTITCAPGGLDIAIRETLLSRMIKCHIVGTSERKAFLAVSYDEKRVEVYGMVRHDNDGTPMSVTAEEIVPFPDPCEIPCYKDVKGILAKYD